MFCFDCFPAKIPSGPINARVFVYVLILTENLAEIFKHCDESLALVHLVIHTNRIVKRRRDEKVHQFQLQFSLNFEWNDHQFDKVFCKSNLYHRFPCCLQKFKSGPFWGHPSVILHMQALFKLGPYAFSLYFSESRVALLSYPYFHAH